MAFGLTMGTDRATALQNAIEAEWMRRQYSSEPGECIYASQGEAENSVVLQDTTMAEYITIMVINNKTPGEHASLQGSLGIWIARGGTMESGPQRHIREKAQC